MEDAIQKEKCPICSHELQEQGYCDYCALVIEDNYKQWNNLNLSLTIPAIKKKS